MTRGNTSDEKRKTWFEGRLKRARGAKARLLVACEWLVAEAWNRERVVDAEQQVLAAVRNVRGEEAPGEHNGH